MSAVAVEPELSLGFKVPRGILYTLLTKAVAVVPTSDNLEVLKHFQIRAEDGKLTVASTDTQLSVVTVASLVEISGEGMAVFPAIRLLGLVKEASDGDLEILVTGRDAEIRSGQARWSLKLADPEDFPELPEVEDLNFAPISRTDLVTALSATRSAVSRDSMRPNLNVVSVKGGAFESSDGVRYHRVNLSADLGDLQIPANALDDLLGLLLNSDASEVEVAQDENMVLFRLDQDVYTAQKLVAKFPDMEKAILKPAQTNNLRLKVDRLELQAAVRRVRVTSDEETSAVTLVLEEGSSNDLLLESRDKYGSWASELVPVAWDGPDLEITVNHRHLLDALDVVTADTVVLALGKGTKTKPAPVLVQAAESVSLAVLSQLRKEFTG